MDKKSLTKPPQSPFLPLHQPLPASAYSSHNPLDETTYRAIQLDHTPVYNKPVQENKAPTYDWQESTTFRSIRTVEELPPDCPSYIEPSYHFSVPANFDGGCRFFLERVCDQLAARDIEYDYEPEKFRITCSAVNCHNAKVPFVVSVFKKDSSGKQCVCEFQRRAGCIMQFSTLYKAIKSVFCVDSSSSNAAFASLAADAPSDAVTHGFDGFPSVLGGSSDFLELGHEMPLSDNSCTNEQAAETISIMVEMLESEFADVKSKAIQVLSDLSQDDQMVSAILKHPTAVRSILTCLDSTDEEIYRCAISTVVHLTSKKDNSLASQLEQHTAALNKWLAKVNSETKPKQQQQSSSPFIAAASFGGPYKFASSSQQQAHEAAAAKLKPYSRTLREALTAFANLCDNFEMLNLDGNALLGVVSVLESCQDHKTQCQAERISKRLGSTSSDSSNKSGKGKNDNNLPANVSGSFLSPFGALVEPSK